ncbi:Lipase 1 [Actinomadura rubteroloni]|uniref:Poly(ethylene terephthalate) hydrolase n=1 Tax=Actinomadura rubteroloni TaxID=1926885 RepID=A0A2P4UDC3_9ACTN|nr:alpha/beta hydrolase [Actinomadura rubteroloni]POM23048.1 Lipase 1 [Actinomadura rubteroloni]
MPSWSHARPKTALTAVAAFAALTSVTAVTSPAHADSNPFQRGPAPTEASVSAQKGPFATAQVNVPAGSGDGFNDGTIYYPTDTSQGTFGAIAVMPGFLSPQDWIRWYGPLLASQGFVVMTLDSKGFVDSPSSRGDQLLAALDYLTTKSKVVDRIDTSRLGVVGWSMGGGGALESSYDRPSLKADVALAPWHVGLEQSKITVPSMIIADDGDWLAPTGSFAKPFYNGIPDTTNKALIELKNANHFTFTGYNKNIAKYAVSWLKRFVDNDNRYDQFLCPKPATNNEISQSEATCPLH